MPVREDDDEWGDSPYGDEGDDYEDDAEEEPTRDCPWCGCEMPEDCIQCPSCRQYLSREDTPERRQPMWVILTAVVCLGAILFWFLVLSL